MKESLAKGNPVGYGGDEFEYYDEENQNSFEKGTGLRTNLDGLDKDQILNMIEQEVDGVGFDHDKDEGVL